jgi:hypothetical protein
MSGSHYIFFEDSSVTDFPLKEVAPEGNHSPHSRLDRPYRKRRLDREHAATGGTDH